MEAIASNFRPGARDRGHKTLANGVASHNGDYV